MENKFIKIKKSENHEYYYAERLGVDSIAFILYDKNKGYGLINEYKPPINEFVVTAFGGSLDKNKTKLEIVIDEVREESGYIVDSSHIVECGKRFVSTQMNQFCWLYYVDVSKAKYVGRQPENKLESIANVVWIDDKYITNYNFQDWKAQVILLAIGNK